ncbi:hypothetical protein TEA_023762 [Camellia sinensis var. sinensis]|uniref:Uncharacterized protein n=1 Tax=Camellia sinensis var. sinensis TaxID=542762 RepID=A0A4S4ENX7_CAMSN|nr:hypothetical protein TEA_023762 [Camellia sinensis var. sinensis]
MSVFWLAPEVIILGIGDGFTLVGLQEYFYDQVSNSMNLCSSWADSVTTVETAEAGSTANNTSAGNNSARTRSTYVPPHLHNRASSSDPPAPVYSSSNSGTDGSGAGGWDRGREQEVNLFAGIENTEEEVGEQEKSGINFDAYEDIPVETSGDRRPTIESVGASKERRERERRWERVVERGVKAMWLTMVFVVNVAEMEWGRVRTKMSVLPLKIDYNT